MIYNFFYAFHKILIAFHTPFKAAFEYEPSWTSVYFDLYLDIVFFADILITFNMPLYDEKSRLITDRKVISLKYLRTWFLVDLIICFPLSYLRKTSHNWEHSSDFQDIFTLNFTAMPYAYKVLLLAKILRVRRVIEFMTYCLKKTSLRMQAQQIFLTCYTMAFILQLSGCCWRLLADLNHTGNKNWLRTEGMADSPTFQVYITSLYWAVVTCCTVGYGDIVPVNGFELAWGMLTIVIGVAVFSFVLGDLAS